jgi:hypothetical protein
MLSFSVVSWFGSALPVILTVILSLIAADRKLRPTGFQVASNNGHGVSQ